MLPQLRIVSGLLLLSTLLIFSGCGDPNNSGNTPDTSADISTFDTIRDGNLPDISGEVADTGECLSLGCPCEDDEECSSGYCIRSATGDGGICSEFCVDECSLEDYDCLLLENSDGDAVRLCVPNASSYCLPCARDADCGSLDAFCIEQAGGRYCATPCPDDRSCPGNGVCTEVNTGLGIEDLCVPLEGVCEECLDEDDDARGRGINCLGIDCDDDDPTVYDGAPEFCDNKDNDCDDEIDEGIDLDNDVNNCGECGNVCEADNTTFLCVEGECVVDECEEPWVDCNEDPEDGCESDLTDPDGCGFCTPPDRVLSTPCGVCGDGTWTCSVDDEIVECVGDPGEDRRNPCGGCEILEADPGTACGVCELGFWSCADRETLVCDGEDELNACGGCAALVGEPGEACGTCGEDLFECDGEEAVACSGDTTNECGGCDELDGAIGDSCGSCAEDVLECDGEEAFVCSGDSTNECGGCDVLEDAVGDPCGSCGVDALACDGLEALACDDDTTNTCGGCETLAAEPGDACGSCGVDIFTCDGIDSVLCNGDTTNDCGGCTTLPEVVATACGQCDAGLWTCGGAELVLCDLPLEIPSDCVQLRSLQFGWTGFAASSGTVRMVGAPRSDFTGVASSATVTWSPFQTE